MTLLELRRQIEDLPWAHNDDQVYVCLDLGGDSEVITLQVTNVDAVDCEPGRHIEVWINVEISEKELLKHVARATQPVEEN